MMPRFCYSPKSLFVFAFLLSPLTAQNFTPATPSGTWIYPAPTDLPTFNYIDTLNASWVTNFPSAYLELWCSVPDGTNATLCSNTSVPFTGNQNVGLDCGGAGTCHIEIISPNLDLFLINSGKWKVKQNPQLKPVVWSQGPAAPPPSTTTIYDPPTPIFTDYIVTHTVVSSRLSPGGKAGVGVGVSLGVLLLLAGMFLPLWMRRRRLQNGHRAAKELNASTGLERKEIPRKPGVRGMHEMEGTSERSFETNCIEGTYETAGDGGQSGFRGEPVAAAATNGMKDERHEG